MKPKILSKMINELVNQRDTRFPVRKKILEVLRPTVLSNRISKPVAGGEEIPEGGWRASPNSFLLNILGVNTSRMPTIHDVYRTKDGRHPYFMLN